MSIHRYTIEYSKLIDPGSLCVNPSISYINPTGITIPCSDDGSVDIEINTDVDGPYCLTFVLDCSDSCSSCGTIYKKKCFCVNVDDCGDCGECVGNICVDRCAGKICEGDTCVDCNDENPCPSNQECVQGTCKCPADKPIKRADGKCVECLDSTNLGNCLKCEDGVIVAEDCPNGYCNPNNGDCQECLNNSHCDNPNECCGSDGKCSCCPGYYLDPITNQCIPKPPCTSAEDCWELYGKCYTCGPDGCEPTICPEGYVCDPTTGKCVHECGNCPEGYGCINGRCVPCSSLSCTGSGELCQFAVGCECNGNVCEYVNCNPDTIEFAWEVSNGTPGQVINSGQPAIQGTTVISPLSIVHEQPPAGSNYMNHQFTLGVVGATSGQWTLYNTPTSTISLGSGASVTFDLTSTGPNLVGFVVKFVETGTGRTATWGIFRQITAPLTAPNVWSYEFNSTGTPPTTIGGTPGSVQLCATNGNFIPSGVTNVVTTGDINITFFATGTNCLTAIITGCGVWNGDVVVECAGNSITVPAPEFVRDPANCCDPTDPTCDGWSDGEPCQDLTVQPITLVALPTYGTNGSGDGEFLVVADWTSANLSFTDLFFLNPAAGCWGTSDNPAASSNDIAIVTNSSQSPLGPSVSALSRVITIGDGGCIHLGKNCTLRIAGCKRLEGELCMKECDIFSVDIVDLGSNTYTAVTSLADEQISYSWSYPGLLTTTNQTVTITPVGGQTSLIVTASYGSPVKCSKSDVIVLNTFIAGCTDPTACNYNSQATANDNSCVYVGAPTYDCELGFQPGTETQQLTAAITYRANGTAVVKNGKLNPGNYTIEVYVNGLVASRCTQTLVVPQCYNCSAGNCVPAPSGNNTGAFSENTCGDSCDCAISVNVTEQCTGNRTALIISATGDTGLYTVTVNETNGANVLPLTQLSTGSTVSTSPLCNGNYTITVTGENCSQTKTYQAACHNCADSALALGGAAMSCTGNSPVTFTLTGDPCGNYTNNYTVQILDGSLALLAFARFSQGGTYSIPLGSYPGDGIYYVKVIDVRNSCTRTLEFTANCNGTLTDCPITSAGLSYTDDSVNISFTSTFVLSEAGGSYSVTLYNTTGGSPANCSAAVPDTVISTQTVTGALGTNTINFVDAVPTPGVPTCYAVKVQRLGAGYAACSETDVVRVVAAEAPPNCAITINSTSYNSSTEKVVVGWTGDDTSGDLTIQIKAYPNASCGSGTPVIFTQSGLGEDSVGNISFGAFPQISGQAQCVEVTIYDTNDPTCTVTSSFTIAACTCAVEVLSTEIDNEAETATVEYRTKCTTGDVTIDISGDATGSASDAAASTDGQWVTNEKVIALSGYPSINGSIVVEITDDANALCTDNETVSITGNCDDCAQVASLYDADSVVTQIIDFNANVLATGSYDVVDDQTSLQNDTEAALLADGANFCTNDPVDVAAPREAGVSINQDSSDFKDINYALVSNSTWTGTKRFYFGDCGCETGRTCDYTTTIAIGANVSSFSLHYGVNSAAEGYTAVYSNTIDQAPSGTHLANLQTAIKSALTGSSCAYTVGVVSVTYNSGTNELTITINDTNAALGVVTLTASGFPAQELTTDFTQSGCA